MAEREYLPAPVPLVATNGQLSGAAHTRAIATPDSTVLPVRLGGPSGASGLWVAQRGSGPVSSDTNKI